MTTEEIFMSMCVFIFGALIGSFLNVCIVRMPQEKSVVWPGSYCLKCQKPISWYDNIPFISYFFLGGKCRFCAEKISIRYFVVEFITAITFLIFYQHFGGQWILLPYLILVSGLIVATFIDLEHRIIPDEISLGGIVVGLIFSFALPQMHATYSHWLSLWKSFLGVLIGGGSIYAMGMLGDWLFKKESMGGGDVKLLAAIGAFLGWQLAVLTFFIAPFFGAVVGIYEKIRTKDSTIAYGPFLALGAIISLFYGPLILNWIFNNYGLGY